MDILPYYVCRHFFRGVLIMNKNFKNITSQ